MALNNHKFVNNHIPNEEEVSLRSLSSEDVSQVVPRGYCCAKSINPADGRGRKLHLLQMLVLPFIPILALIVQTSVTLVNIMVLKHDSIEVENQVNNSFKMVRSNIGNEIVTIGLNDLIEFISLIVKSIELKQTDRGRKKGI